MLQIFSQSYQDDEADTTVEDIQEMIKWISWIDIFYELRQADGGQYTLVEADFMGRPEKDRAVLTGSLDDIKEALRRDYEKSRKRNSGKFYQ